MTIEVSIVVSGQPPIRAHTHHSGSAGASTSHQSTTPTATAEIRINQQVYQLTLDAKLTKRIADIETLVPAIELLFAKELAKLGKKPIDFYEHPLHVTVQHQDKTTQAQSFTVTGSAKALYNLINVLQRKDKSLPRPSMLIVHDRVKLYQYCTFMSGGLEGLAYNDGKGIFCQPMDLSHLIQLKMSIAPNSENVLGGLTSLLKKNCLPHVQSIELYFSRKSRPYINANGQLCSAVDTLMPRYALEGIYRAGLQPTNLRGLKYLRMAFWSEDSTASGLNALETQYSHLTTLIIDDILSNMKETKVQDSNYVHGSSILKTYDMGLYKVERWVDYSVGSSTKAVLVPDEEKQSDAFGELLRKHVSSSKLEELQIYDWGVVGQPPQFAHARLAYYLQEGLLPYLNRIVMRSHPDYVEADGNPIHFDTAMNTTHLLGVLLDKNVRIEKLDLRMPEKLGYLPWLEAVKLGQFPKLTELDYLVPAPYEGEDIQVHQARIKMALEMIEEAIKLDAAPFKMVRIEGNMSEALRAFADSIEDSVGVETMSAVDTSSSLSTSEEMPVEEDFVLVSDNHDSVTILQNYPFSHFASAQ